MTGQVTDALHLAGTARVGDLVLEVERMFGSESLSGQS